MQYNVPQFVDVEDKIIGPLGLKQFMLLLAGGLLSLLYWSIFKNSLTFYLLALPTMGFFAFLGFGKFNGRPVLPNVPSFIRFFSAPKVRVFQRTGENPLPMVRKAPEKLIPQSETAETAEVMSSRLHRLAYLLDQKASEEDRLIQSGELKGKWLNEI